MKNIIQIFVFLMIGTTNIMAQKAHFLKSGKIYFERKDNVYYNLSLILKEEQGNWVEDYLDRYKKPENHFATSSWVLFFDDSITNFTINKDVVNKDAPWFTNTNTENTTYSNLQTNQIIRNEHIYESSYLIKDSTRNIKWKLTSETREIAGINCKRANAIIMDSIYVVAFYTDEIPTKGGPELFSGLPGMILGVALPYDHISWFATKVEDMVPNTNDFKYPSKGKAFTTKEMIAELTVPLKNRGATSRNLIFKNLQL